MAHELKPRSGNLPPASEIACRLAAEFAFTRTSEIEGTDAARVRADWIEQAPARLFLGRHREALEHASRLRSLAHGQALVIEFGDDPKVTKRIVVLPGEPINFGYSSNDDQARSKDLVERCARVLDCDLIAI